MCECVNARSRERVCVRMHFDACMPEYVHVHIRMNTFMHAHARPHKLIYALTHACMVIGYHSGTLVVITGPFIIFLLHNHFITEKF